MRAADRQTMRAALDWALRARSPARGLELATWLESFWVDPRDRAKGDIVARAALARPTSAPAAAACAAPATLGGTCSILGDPIGPARATARASTSSARSATTTTSSRCSHASPFMPRGGAPGTRRDDWSPRSRPHWIATAGRSASVECQMLGFLGQKSPDREGDLPTALELTLDACRGCGTRVRVHDVEALELDERSWSWSWSSGGSTHAEAHAPRGHRARRAPRDRRITVFAPHRARAWPP